MQDKNYIKPFLCNLHPSEPIEKISIEKDVDAPLKCHDCIITDFKTSRSSLLPINDFIEKIISQYQSLPQTSFTKTTIPHEYIEFLNLEEEKTKRLSVHIGQEKKKVNSAFDSLIEEFTKTCHSRKEDLINQLDKQLVALQLNYQYYQSMINKYYKNQNDLQMKTQEAFLEKINQCQDTNHLEFLIKSIKEDIAECISPHQPAAIFPNLAKDLQQRSDLLPRSKLSNQGDDVLISQLKDITRSFFEGFASIEPQIPGISLNLALIHSFSFDSKLIQKQDEILLLKKWLTPEGEDIKLKLLFRGSRDGMNLQALYEKCENHKNTLVIAKSSFGKILGGFSDQPWSGKAANLGWQKSEKAFLFSMAEKEKFPIVRRRAHEAVYVHHNSGLTFGRGDLSLNFEDFVVDQDTFELLSSDSMTCCSNLGCSYDNQGDQDKTLLAGAYKFALEEIEMYSVESLKN